MEMTTNVSFIHKIALQFMKFGTYNIIITMLNTQYSRTLKTI